MKINPLSRMHFFVVSAIVFHLAAVAVASPRTEAGLTLRQPYGARAAALNETVATLENDIAAFGYNPASLASLKNGHMSFSFQQGLADDSFSHVLLGLPTEKGGFGLVVGHYDGGQIALIDRTVTAQKDLLIGIGFARTWGRVSIGTTAKYLSSTLGETYTANAYAADAGISSNLTARMRLSMSIQNYGTQLKYQDTGDDLPRTMRVSASYTIAAKMPTMIMFDAPYSANQKQVKPAIGLEAHVGPLALRGGYKVDGNNKNISLGTGFMMGGTSLDYAFGLINENNSLHRVSFSFRFGGSVKQSKESPTRVIFEQPTKEFWPATESAQ
jgi:hypothetical protein